MTTQYIRRPFMVGNTAVDTHGQPYITGTLTELDISGVDPLDPLLQLRVETASGIFEFTFVKTATIAEIQTAITTAATDVTAIVVDGVLRVGSSSSTPDAFVRILEADGLPNAAPCLGLRVYPHPMATVRNGDLIPAPVRTDVEGNPSGTLFLARGEDRLAKNFNRVLHQIAINLDTHQLQLVNRVAEPVVLTLAPGDSRLVLDGSGQIIAVNLPEEDYVYIGGIENGSSLSEIARNFIVADLEGNPLRVESTLAKVWISAVTRGARASFPGTPSFSSSTADPVGPLANTAAVSPDGGSALGVIRAKVASTAINEIKDGTIFVCSTASFISSGVTPYDLVTVSSGPIANQGTWIVSRVISESELEVYGANDASSLTEGEGGPLGTLEITSDGKFERDIQISFTPPIPRVGPGFLVGYGVARERGYVEDAGHLLALAFNRRSAADTWDSVYDGPVLNGGGSYARVTGHPFTAHLLNDGTVTAGSLVRSGTGAALLAGNVLVAPTSGSLENTYFTEADLGRVVRLTHASLNSEMATIVALVDAGTVRLLPYERTELPALSAVSFAIYDGAFHDFPSSISVVTRSENDAEAGFAYFEESEVQSTGYGFAHLRRISETPTGVNTRALSASASGNTITVATALEESFQFTPETETSAGTLLRVLNGDHAGFYRCVSWATVGLTTVITVKTLNNTVPSLSGSMRVGFYYPILATNVPAELSATRFRDGAHITGRAHAGPHDALHVTGSIYQKTDSAENFGFGGIFTETGSVSGVFSSPMWSAALPSGGVAKLGQPSVILEALSVALSGADPTKFNIPHTAVVEVSSGLLIPPFSQYVGCGIAFTGGTLDGTAKPILAVKASYTGSNLWLALGDTVSIAATEACTAAILGNRWTRSYIDVANWTAVGTEFLDPEFLPMLTFSTLSSISRTTASLQSFSAVEAYSKVIGAGVGLSKALDDMTISSVDLDAQPSIHTVDPDAKMQYFTWSTDNEEPRPPFQNTGIITGDLSLDTFANVDVPYIGGEYSAPGSFTHDDLQILSVSAPSGNAPVVKYGTSYGGCLRVEAFLEGPGVEVGVTDTIRLKLKTLPKLVQNKFHFTVRLKIQAGLQVPYPEPPILQGTSIATIAVRRDSGSVLASEDIDLRWATSEFAANYDLFEYEVDLFSSDFITDAETTAESQLVSDAHITIDIPVAGARIYDGLTVAQAPSFLNILEWVVTPKVRAIRIAAPLAVEGPIVGASLRLSSAVHGFQTVGPAEVELLSGQDYGDNVGHTRYGHQEGAYGVGLLWKFASASFGYFFQPVFQVEQFFKKTPHSAAIVGYHPYFDPLFYVIANGNGDSLNTLYLPGKTGFIVPLNPPHGAKLTSLAFNLGFLPAEHWTDPGDVVADFQVWSRLPPDLATPTDLSGATDTATWRDIDQWRLNKGFMVKLWRYNAMNHGFSALKADTYTGSGVTGTSQAGFGEVIWERRMRLPSSEPTSFSNLSSISGDPIGAEFPVSEVFNLTPDAAGSTTPASRASALVVDRSHYAYFMTIEFYIGRRERSTTDGLYTYHSEGLALQDSYIPQTESFNKLSEITGGWEDLPAQVISTRHPFVAYNASPYNGGSPGEDWKPRAPVVKFRGARLGWLTDRPGNGGWGG
jgi:hypothetical protein